MKRTTLARVFVIMLIVLPLGISTQAMAAPGDSRQVLQGGLPQITFLGQGPQTFTIEPPLKFLVKTYQNGQFLFIAQDGPTYKARREERVWTIDVVPTETIRLFDELKSFGNVQAGCVVNYVQIEDNVDTRRNTFYINGKVLQVVEQGMVTYGNFTVPETGELTFFAEDSIGMVIELCQTAQTVVPGASPTATSTLAVTPSATVTQATATATDPAADTQTPTFTPTSTAPATNLTLSPSPTSTVPPVVLTLSPTATSTAPPTNLTQSPTSTSTAPPVNLTLSPSSTPQSSILTPSATAQIIRITATPIATVAAFPVTGGGPGPGEISAIALTLLVLSLLVGAAWWFLIRTYLQRR